MDHMRYRTAACSLAMAIGCGGQPVGGKVPAAKPAHVGGAAAAAAALVTLADPDAARQRQENRGGERSEDRTKKSGGTVPEGVLFAPANPAEDSEELPPCKKKEDEKSEEKVKSSPKTVELFPPLTEGAIATPARCRDKSDEEGDADGDQRSDADNE